MCDISRIFVKGKSKLAGGVQESLSRHLPSLSRREHNEEAICRGSDEAPLPIFPTPPAMGSHKSCQQAIKRSDVVPD